MHLNPNEPQPAPPLAPLALGIPADLVFDDDPLEALLHGTQPVAPTPADVLELWRQGLDRSPACARALAAVLGRNPDFIGGHASEELNDLLSAVAAAMPQASKPSELESNPLWNSAN